MSQRLKHSNLVSSLEMIVVKISFEGEIQILFKTF